MVKVSVIVPAHNEAENLQTTIERLVETLDDHGLYEIIIIDDNSTDMTGQVAHSLAADYSSIQVIASEQNPGIGNAIVAGLRAADGDILIPFMADQSDNPATIPDMVDEIAGGADVVYASRFIEGGSMEGYPLPKYLANRCYNWLVRILFRMPQHDISNAFAAYRRDVVETIGLDSIAAEDFDITIELPVKAHIHGFSAVEVPTRWRSRKNGASSLQLRTKGPQYLRRLLLLYNEYRRTTGIQRS